MKSLKELRKSLEEMTIGSQKSTSGKKVEWTHHLGLGHSVTVNDEPVHSGFVSREAAAKHYQKALMEDSDVAAGSSDDDLKSMKRNADDLSNAAHMKSGDLDSSSSANDHLDALKAHAAARSAHDKSSAAHGAAIVNAASQLAAAGPMDMDNLEDHIDRISNLAGEKNDSEREMKRHDNEIAYHSKFINESVGDEAYEAILAEWGEPLSAIVKSYGTPGVTVHKAGHVDDNEEALQASMPKGASTKSTPTGKSLEPSEKQVKQLAAAGKARIHKMEEGIEFEVHKVQTGLYVAELYDGEELVKECHAPTEQGAIKLMEGVITATIKELDESYSPNNPKIDLFVDGKYHSSTNWSPTVKHAVESFKEKFPEHSDKKIKGEISK